MSVGVASQSGFVRSLDRKVLAVKSRVAPPRWILFLDMLIFCMLPLLSCIDIATDGKLSRIYYSLLLIGLLLIKLIVLPAVSIHYMRAQQTAIGYLITGKNKLWMALFLYLLVIFIAHIRGFFTGTMPFGAFFGFALWALSTFVFVYLSVAMHMLAGREKYLIGAFFGGLALYLCVNFVAYALGFHGTIAALPSEYGGNRLMSLIGLSTNRLTFPISSGPTAFGPIAGMLTTIGLCLLMFSKSKLQRFAGLLAALLGLIGVFLVDSRSALVSIPMALVLAFSFARSAKLRKVWLAFAVLLPLVPLIMVGIVQIMSQTEIAAVFQRQGGFAQKLGVASGRESIWMSVMHFFANPDPIHIIGFGAYGQIISGVSREYSWVFNQAGAALATAHNASLQVLLDCGYVGVAIWVLLVYRVQRAALQSVDLARFPDAALLLSASSFYFVISGFFDVSTTFYQADTFPLFLGIVAILVAIQFGVSINQGLSPSVASSDPRPVTQNA